MLKYCLMFCVVFALIFVAHSEKGECQIEHLNPNRRNAELSQSNAECFSTYNAKLNELTSTYKLQHAKCGARTALVRGKTDPKFEIARKELVKLTTEVCNKFQNCYEKDESTYEFFACFSEVASESIKSAYNTKNVAIHQMDQINMDHIAHEFHRKGCADKQSQLYVEEATKAFNYLEECLANLAVGQAIL